MKRMTRPFSSCAVVLVLLLAPGGLLRRATTQAQNKASSGTQTKDLAPASDDLIYADFGTMKYDRPASNRGGFIQLFSFQESPRAPATAIGMQDADPPAPKLVRLKEQDTAATFGFEFSAPNQYAGVGMVVIGLADQDGTPVAEDVSGYSYLTVQASASGVKTLTVEFLSQGQGSNVSVGSPQSAIAVTPAFTTYKIPLAELAQPAWAPVKVNTKDVLKKLTAINFIVSCTPCSAAKGIVVLDNVVFHR